MDDSLLVSRGYFHDCRLGAQSNQRDMDREIRELDRQEKQITMELKQRAKVTNSNSDPTLKTLAKQLVQVRQQRSKLQGAKAQLGAMGMHAQVTASQIAAVQAVGSVTQSMKTANKQMNMKETMKTMTEFQRENERMNIKTEMMDDVLMDAFDSEGVEEEADQVTNQVLAELGVEMDKQMVGLDAPKTKLAAEAEQDEVADALPDLRARLNAL